jgi:hypothetical protein
VSNNKDPNKRRPGEKEDGTFHYNPGNMSGKTAEPREDKSKQKPSDESRHEKKEKNAVDKP